MCILSLRLAWYPTRDATMFLKEAWGGRYSKRRRGHRRPMISMVSAGLYYLGAAMGVPVLGQYTRPRSTESIPRSSECLCLKDRPLEGQDRPRGAQDLPRVVQDRSRTVPGRPRTVPGRPKAVPGRPRTIPGPSQGGPGVSRGRNLDFPMVFPRKMRPFSFRPSGVRAPRGGSRGGQ